MTAQKPFFPIAVEYDPLAAGSIDGTDTIPHDHGVIRALEVKYKPNKGVNGDPACTVFVSRLNHATTEDMLLSFFERYGTIVKCHLVRDIVTGFSRGYGFVEFASATVAERAADEAYGAELDDKYIFCDMECERTLPGWVPRRLGGGFGGLKESGQLRFGGKDRPFRKPILPIKLGGVQDTDSFSSRSWNRERRSRSHSSERHKEERQTSRNDEKRRDMYKDRWRRSRSREKRSASRERRDRQRSQSRERGNRQGRSRSRERARSRSRERKKKKRSRSREKKRDRSRSRERKREKRSRSRERKRKKRSRSGERKDKKKDKKRDRRSRSKESHKQ